MLKNAYFLEKTENRLSVGESATRTSVCLKQLGALTPALLLPPYFATLYSSFQSANYCPKNEQKSYSKCSALLLPQYCTYLSFQIL